MLDYWLWRRQLRINHATTFWTATLFALPGILAAGHFLPVTLNTIDGLALFGHGAAAGAGLGVGLAVSLRGVFREAGAEWFGLVLGLMLAAGTAASIWNTDVPEAERRMIASRVVVDTPPAARHHLRWLELRGLDSVHVEWEGGAQEAVVAKEQGPFREGTPLLLSVHPGRLGYPVIERVHAAD